MNLIGKRFGKLYVIEKTNEKAKNNGEYKYMCVCDCGKKILVRGSNLKYGNSKSCGCTGVLKRSYISKGYRKNNIRLYNIYSNIKVRCYNKNCPDYKNYGARGIKMCDEWLNDFVSFYNWATANGYEDNLTIDRINNDGNYEPSNCRWITLQEQAYNKRTNRYITYNGTTKTLAEWAKTLNMSQQKLRYRILNWDIKDAFER